MLGTIAWIGVATVATIAGCELLRRSSPRRGLALLWGLPLLGLGPWSATEADFTWFSWAKLMSVCLAAGAVVAMRTRARHWPAMRTVLVAILVLNIAEALVAEALQRGFTLNVAAAGLLLITMPGPRAIEADDDGMRYALTGWWIAAYSVWNFTFVYGHVYPDAVGPYAAFAVVHLVTPLLVMRADPARYMEARAFALALLMIWRFSFPESPWLIRTPELFVPALHHGLSVGSLLLASVVGLRAWQSGRGLVGSWTRCTRRARA